MFCCASKCRWLCQLRFIFLTYSCSFILFCTWSCTLVISCSNSFFRQFSFLFGGIVLSGNLSFNRQCRRRYCCLRYCCFGCCCSFHEFTRCMNSKLANQMHALGVQFEETNKSVNRFFFLTTARMCVCSLINEIHGISPFSVK